MNSIHFVKMRKYTCSFGCNETVSFNDLYIQIQKLEKELFFLYLNHSIIDDFDNYYNANDD